MKVSMLRRMIHKVATANVIKPVVNPKEIIGAWLSRCLFGELLSV